MVSLSNHLSGNTMGVYPPLISFDMLRMSGNINACWEYRVSRGPQWAAPQSTG